VKNACAVAGRLNAVSSACGVLTLLEITLSQIFPSRGAIRAVPLGRCRKRLDVRTVGCRFRHRQGASSGADWLRGSAWAVYMVEHWIGGQALFDWMGTIASYGLR
jgi:hypothetical protein